VVNIGHKLSPEKLAFSRDFSRDLGFWCVLFGYSRKPGRLQLITRNWKSIIGLKRNRVPPFHKYKVMIFFCKSKLPSRKVCYGVSLCENWQQQSCKAFTGLPCIVQVFGGCHPFLREILDQSHPPPSKTATLNRYSLVAAQP